MHFIELKLLTESGNRKVSITNCDELFSIPEINIIHNATQI